MLYCSLSRVLSYQANLFPPVTYFFVLLNISVNVGWLCILDVVTGLIDSFLKKKSISSGCLEIKGPARELRNGMTTTMNYLSVCMSG